MLNKQHRYSFRGGSPRKSSQTPFFVLRYEKAEKFTCGIVVSKKIARLAVDRNRIKRMYKTILGSIQNEKEFHYSIVLYVRKQSVDATVDEIRQNIEQIFKKEGII